MNTKCKRRVRVLVNRRAGFMWSFESVQKAFDKYWSSSVNDLSYQFCTSAADGIEKARRAAEQKFDILLVVGGDGTVNTTGTTLVGTDTVMGVIPMGSGNGFARHFGIPLKPEEAVRSLADAQVREIDVGIVNGRTFLVTCSMAWDAAIVRSFDKSPVRGVIPYIFAGVSEFLEYQPQPMSATLETGEIIDLPNPFLFTLANLTQFGGGAVIAPGAKADDGHLELVAALHQDAPLLFANLPKLFRGVINEMESLIYRKFSYMKVKRAHAAPIQIDGELVDAPAEIEVSVKSRALKVLAPGESC